MLIFRESIPSTYEQVDLTVREIVNRCKNVEALNNKSFLFQLSVALREVLNNAVEHGNGFDADKYIMCEIVYRAPKLEMRIRDEGPGIVFDPARLHEAEVLHHRNRGLKMLAKMGFEFEVCGNEIRVAHQVVF